MILVVNSGSSSLKFRVFTPKLAEVASGIVERIGLKESFLKISAARNGESRRDFTEGIKDHGEAFDRMLTALESLGVKRSDLAAFGHRVVHGGEKFTAPLVITDENLKELEGFNRLAPLHNPANLMGIAACRALLPNVPNIAVFDTAFYRTLPDFVYMYSLPWDFYAAHHIRKYGFHGISHEYVAGETARLLKKPLAKLNLVTCHLGSGSSITAVKRGKAFDTSMGFTPLEGLTMSTRCGDIDPAIPLYLMRELNLSERDVDDLMNKRSGLLGISGYKDLRDVMSAAGYKVKGYEFTGEIDEELRRRARLAVDMFCYDAARYIGQFSAVIGGADAVVFTAGVGERNAFIRKRIMSMVKLAGKPKVLVVPTNEELMIAREVAKKI